MAFDLGQIVNLVGQLGGNQGQALQRLQGVGGGQVDPQQHGGLLQELGIDPDRLAGGGYQQHLDAQQDPGFQGYDQGGYQGQQGGGYQDQGGGFEHRQEYQQGGYQDQGGFQGQQGGGYQDQQGGYQDQGGFGGQQGGYQDQQGGGYQDQQGGYRQDEGGYRQDEGGYREDEGYRG